MVLKRTETIFICIVIVCSVKIFSVIKYFQKIIIKVKKKKKKKKTIGRFVKSYACLYPFVFKQSVEKKNNKCHINHLVSI